MSPEVVGLIVIEAIGVFVALVVGWFARSKVVKKEHDNLVKWRATVDNTLPQLVEDVRASANEQREFRKEIRKEFLDLRKESTKEHRNIRERLVAIETTLDITSVDS